MLGNLPGLDKPALCVFVHGWKRRSELAGHYPLRLCEAYEKILDSNNEPKTF